MVIIKLQGGLGNQLFQFAMGRAIASANRAALQFDVSWFEGQQREVNFDAHRRAFLLDNFAVSGDIARVSEVSDALRLWKIDAPVWCMRIAGLLGARFTRHVREQSMRFDIRAASAAPPICLEGYWQSERYFRGIRPVLLRELRPRVAEVSRQAEARVQDFRAAGRPLVSVHVRRGDIAHAHESLKMPSMVGLELLSKDYYLEAMRSFGPNVSYVVCSDDLAWCRENLTGERVYFFGGNSPIDDFEVLRRCDHHIIANSTFSWWAAWLNESEGKRVVAPKKWFTSDFPLDYSMDDLIPPEWTLL
jgi:hypothetical protein